MALGAGGRFPHAIVLRLTGAALQSAVPTPAPGAYSKAHAVWPASIAMSLLHRLNLLEKFLILGTIGLMMSALPTYLVVRDILNATELQLPPANLSFHFKALVQSGLLTVEQEGRFQRYRAHMPLMLDLIDYLVKECCDGHPEQCAGLCDVPVGASPADQA